MAVIGIDLGTTNSLASVWKDSRPVIIRNSLGSILTPSVVGVDEDNNVVVGEVARERLISHPDKTVSEFKRSMGTKKTFSVGDNSFTPEQLSSLVLNKIKEDAEAFLGDEITEAVISVPAYFDDCRRSATKQAAEMSGLKVERLINEPSAAALAYMQKHGFEDGTYMVIDFGGGIKSTSDLETALGCGASMVTIGSTAVTDPDLMSRWIEDFGQEHIILGADARDGKISVNGWKEDSALQLSDFIHDYMQKGITQVLCTDINKDGMLQGPSTDLYRSLLKEFPGIYLIASGGVSSADDLIQLKQAGLPAAIVGKAYYEGRITLEQLSQLSQE